MFSSIALFAGGGAAGANPDLTMTWVGFACLIIFVVGYYFVAADFLSPFLNVKRTWMIQNIFGILYFCEHFLQDTLLCHLNINYVCSL